MTGGESTSVADHTEWPAPGGLVCGSVLKTRSAAVEHVGLTARP